MTEQRLDGYQSTVIASMQVILGLTSGVAVAIILVAIEPSLWPVAIVLFLGAASTGWYLAPLTVDIGNMRVTVGQGRSERNPHVVYIAEIRDAELRELTWTQCLGFGIENDDRTTRLAVRPGATLVLTLHDGQRLLVSVDDGPAALSAIGAAG